ncbi:hypothetical protein QYF61_010978 [Mycteria americana]|uniref:Uncharacterized protein n=1 Tax=Mycteria americana TaxID=33587 RepID=A0AAN7NIP0_MYCAM|nr:hypothetical protein QYF61_010978 [Mycteria americana]
MPSSYPGAEPICISGVTGASQHITALEAEVSLTGNEGQKHPIVSGPEALCILGIDCFRRGYFKDPKGYWWAFGIAALEMEEIKQLSTLPGLSEDLSVVGLLRVKEQQVPIATTTVGFGVGDTEDPRPATLQLKKRSRQHVKGFELLRKWLVLKHSSCWHPDYWCWAGCSKAWSPVHIMHLMLRGVSGLH